MQMPGFITTDAEIDAQHLQMQAIGDGIIAAGERESVMPQLLTRVWMFEQRKYGNVLAALAVPFNEAAEKQRVMVKCGREHYAKQEIPQIVSLLSEAWQSTQQADAVRVEPRFDPQRTEVLSVMTMSIDRKCRHSYRALGRSPSGELRFEAEWAQTEGTITVPLLANYFNGFAVRTFATRR